MSVEQWADDDPRLTPILLRGELCDRGTNDRDIARLLRQGALHRVRQGAYVSGETWRALDDDGRHAVLTRAVLRRAGTELVVSHTSAAVEWGAPTWGFDLATVHATRPDQRAGRNFAGVVQHRGALGPGDVVDLNDLRVTSPARTVLDVAGLVGSEPALVVANHLAHAGILDPADLRRRYLGSVPDDGGAAIPAMTQWPRHLSVHPVLHLVDARIESVGESRLRHLLWQFGLPEPVPQWEIRDDAGRLVARLDFALPDHGVWLEFDGRGKYAELRRPGEDVVEVFRREKDRDQRVYELTGWRVLRLRWADLERPHATAARIRRFIFGPLPRP